MTADKNFRMNKSTKYLLATLPKGQRGNFKKSMVSAQLSEEAARRASLRSKGNKEDRTGSTVATTK